MKFFVFFSRRFEFLINVVCAFLLIQFNLIAFFLNVHFVKTFANYFGSLIILTHFLCDTSINSASRRRKQNQKYDNLNKSKKQTLTAIKLDV